MAYSLTWLADVLRAANCIVVEDEGWQDRGRAEMGSVKGVILHHTGGAKTGNAPSLPVVRDGRADLPGPLSHLFLARDGVFTVLAAGRCNHAGVGNWQGITAGNSHFIGIEAQNVGNGKDEWPEAQMSAYLRGVAAILKHIGADPIMAVGHKEYALPRGRKIDPTFDMIDFREGVQNIMEGHLHFSPPTPVAPARSMLRKGDRGNSVRDLQERLNAKGWHTTIDSIFGPATELAVRRFQAQVNLTIDGLVGPKTWKALS